MSLTERIQTLCDDKETTFVGLERQIGLSRGSIRNWDKNMPAVDKLQKVADYFNVTTDFLLGRDLSAKDQKDIAKNVEKIMSDLNSGNNSPLFYGDEIDETDKDLLRNALQNALEIVKIKNKDKYTPKKYK